LIVFAIYFESNFLKMTGEHYICRFVATELATDIIVNVGEVKFYLHKVVTVLTFYHAHNLFFN